MVFSASSDRTVRVWSVTTGQELACFSAESPILALALVPGGTGCVVGDWAGNIYHVRYTDSNAVFPG
jgi:WD40 repeat protein